MPRIYFAVGLALWVSGCSAVDVSPELKLMAEATASTSKETLELVNDDPEGERQARLTNAAASDKREAWRFAGACGPVPSAGDDPGGCRLIRSTGWNEATFEESVRRKFGVVSAYVDALSSMTDAQNDAALIAAYSTALTSIGQLATASEIKSLQDTVAALKQRETSVGQVAKFFLANRRAHLLKRTVLKCRQDFNDLIDEIIAGVMNETQEDEELTRLAKDLDAFLLASEEANLNKDMVAYRAALDGADRAHAAYVEARGKSLLGRIAALAAAHEALAARLQRPATIAEIEKFTRALADLKAGLP